MPLTEGKRGGVTDHSRLSERADQFEERDEDEKEGSSPGQGADDRQGGGGGNERGSHEDTEAVEDPSAD